MNKMSHFMKFKHVGASDRLCGAGCFFSPSQYSGGHNAENPFAYYEEDSHSPIQDYDADKPLNMEPHTPFALSLRRIRVFQVADIIIYRLAVSRDRCEVTVNGRSRDIIVMRCDAPGCVRIRGKRITLVTETGRTYRFVHETDDFRELKLARLAFWSRNEPDVAPSAAYQAVRDLLFEGFSRLLYRGFLRAIVVIGILLIMALLVAYHDPTEINLISVVLFADLLFYIGVHAVIRRNRSAIFTKGFPFVLMLPAVGIFASLLFPAAFFVAVFASIPSFWFCVRVMIFRGTLRQLKAENAELFAAPETGVPS